MDTDLELIYVPCSSLSEAKNIAQTLVREKQIACANIIPQIFSIYEWEGKIVEDKEVLLIAKTSRDKIPAIQARIQELHSYECPCIAAIAISDINPKYASWISSYLAL